MAVLNFMPLWSATSQVCPHKRAQRALGRSPEEKVKDHSGAIYRETLMLSTKYW